MKTTVLKLAFAIFAPAAASAADLAFLKELVEIPSSSADYVRAVKRRPKPYPLLKKPRSEYRPEEVV